MRRRGFRYSTRGATENKFCDAQAVDSVHLKIRRKTYPFCDKPRLMKVSVLAALGLAGSARRHRPEPLLRGAEDYLG